MESASWDAPDLSEVKKRSKEYYDQGVKAIFAAPGAEDGAIKKDKSGRLPAKFMDAAVGLTHQVNQQEAKLDRYVQKLTESFGGSLPEQIQQVVNNTLPQKMKAKDFSKINPIPTSDLRESLEDIKDHLDSFGKSSEAIQKAVKKHFESEEKKVRDKSREKPKPPKEEETELTEDDLEEVKEEKPKKSPPPPPKKKEEAPPKREVPPLPSFSLDDVDFKKDDFRLDPEEFKQMDEEEPVQYDKPKGDQPEEGPGPQSHPPKKTWKQSFQDLSSKAKSWFASAPKNVKKFAEDDAYRRKVVMDAHSAMTSAPEKATKQLIKTFKEEVHEYKEAAHAVGLLASGKKINATQKHALKTAAFHVGLTVAATALTTTGLGAGAAVFAKSMARHVALKAIGSMFEKAHILDELGHVGHGVKHILDKMAAKKVKSPRRSETQQEDGEDNDRLLFDFVSALVAKELENFSAEDTGDVIEKTVQKHDVHEASSLESVVALRYWKSLHGDNPK